MSRVDLLVFGATGFTGKQTVKEIIKLVKKTGTNVTWGVAGRNKKKLEETLSEMSKTEQIDLGNIPIVVADIKDSATLTEMAKRAKVVLNCCGPYRFYGEPVVKACVENKTHHVDVSGEPEYMETMEARYHEKAKENEVYVVSACGFDSIPADLGTVFLKKEFDGQVNSVEVFLDSWRCDVKKTGSTVHYGTWESAVYEVASMGNPKGLKKLLSSPHRLNLTPKLKQRVPLTRSKVIGGKWCLPFPGTDKTVVERSQDFFYRDRNERPIQVGTYVGFTSFITALLIAIGAIFFGILAQFSFGRNLLLKYPKFFSLNFASREGPPEKEAENTYFSMTFSGEGWKEKLSQPTDKYVGKPDKKLVTRVSGKNPAYGATAIFLIMSAITVLEDSELMPHRGGVYPPGAAFSNTRMIERLTDQGIKFEVCPKSF